jgi:repressor LexA
MKKSNTASRLSEIMSERRLRQVDILSMAKPFCKEYGVKLNKNDLSQYVSGKVEPKQDKLTILGLALNVSEAWLMGFDVPKERIGMESFTPETFARFEKAAYEKTADESFLSLSSGAKKLAKDFDRLDSWGKQSVRDLTDNELNRMDQQQTLETVQADEEPRVINLYLEPSAAGIATPTEGEDFEPYELQPDDPQGAAFAVRIQGDSMEPYFPDGSTVFVNHDAMRDGDVGIFSVDGGSVCKQYHYDAVLGMTYLFSLNRKRADCDVVITRSSSHTLVCQGRVITRRHFPVPGMD